MLCDNVCLFACCFCCWLFACLLVHTFNLFCFWSIFFLLVSKIQKSHKKLENQKIWLTLLSFCLKTYFALYLCANGFVHYRALLVSMHSYHCGRNLEIYVIIVNRSSNLLWMISEWLYWSWDMHRLVSIYLPTLYFLFLLKRAHKM